MDSGLVLEDIEDRARDDVVFQRLGEIRLVCNSSRATC